MLGTRTGPNKWGWIPPPEGDDDRDVLVIVAASTCACLWRLLSLLAFLSSFFFGKLNGRILLKN